MHYTIVINTLKESEMIIKIENNLKEILLYLEVLNYRWNNDEKPTEYKPHNSCDYLVVRNNHITYGSGREGVSFEEFKKHNPIQKEHLRSGMVVEFKNRQRCLVIDFMGELLLISNEGCCYALSGHKEDLTCLFDALSINKVFIVSAAHLACMLSKNNSDGQIWKRPKEVELTMDEIAEKFGIDVSQLKIKK